MPLNISNLQVWLPIAFPMLNGLSGNVARKAMMTYIKHIVSVISPMHMATGELELLDDFLPCCDRFEVCRIKNMGRAMIKVYRVLTGP